MSISQWSFFLLFCSVVRLLCWVVFVINEYLRVLSVFLLTIIWLSVFLNFDFEQVILLHRCAWLKLYILNGR